MQTVPTVHKTWLSPRNSLLLFCGLLILLELVLYQDFIWGDKYFVFKDLGDDSYTQMYPTMVQRMRILSGGHLPQWNFNNALGENVYPFWLEPVSTTIIYLFFRNDVAAGMIWVQLVQTFLAGMLFYSFLRSLQFHPFVCLVVGLLYAFNSYNIIAGSWFLFDHAAFYVQFAFLFVALEQFISYQRWWLYPVAIALISFTQPFNIYFAAIVTVLYLLIRFADTAATMRTALITIRKLLLMGIAGLGLSAVLLLSNLHQMLHSARGSGEYAVSDTLKQQPVLQFATAPELRTLLLRMLSGNLEGSPGHYTGWYNYFEAPLTGCGLLVLLLLPQQFYQLKRKQKIAYGAVLFFFALVFCFPFWRYAFWLFSGNYYRVAGLLYMLFVLLFSAKALQFLWSHARLHLKTLLASVGIISGMLLLYTSSATGNADTSAAVIIFFLAAYAILLYFMAKKSTFKYYPALLIAVVCLELIVLYNPVLSNRIMLTTADTKAKAGYADASSKLIETVNKADNSFYRTEKDFYSGISTVYSYNEAKVQDFKGSRTYYSYNNIYYVRFLSSIGLVQPHNETDSRWIPGIVSSPIAMRLCSVKYLLTKKDSLDTYIQQGFIPVKELAGVTLLQQSNSLPLGFCFDTYITQSHYNQLPLPYRQYCLLQAATADPELASQLGSMQQINSAAIKVLSTNSSIDTCVHRLISDTLAMQLHTDDEITGTISTDRQKLLFFSIPYDAGWHLYLNGKEQKIYTAFSGLMAAPISKGQYQVRLYFEDPYRNIGFYLSLISAVSMLLVYGYERYKKKQAA